MRAWKRGKDVREYIPPVLVLLPSRLGSEAVKLEARYTRRISQKWIIVFRANRFALASNSEAPAPVMLINEYQ